MLQFTINKQKGAGRVSGLFVYVQARLNIRGLISVRNSNVRQKCRLLRNATEVRETLMKKFTGYQFSKHVPESVMQELRHFRKKLKRIKYI